MTSFYTTPPGYTKTIFSDLQGAWENLRDAIVTHHLFAESTDLLFHVDEGMSWESVRNLEQMKKTLMIVSNIINQPNAPEEVAHCLSDVNDILDETLGLTDNQPKR